MFKFIKMQFQMGKITAEQVEQCVMQGWVTDAEAEQILNHEKSLFAGN